MQLFTCRLSFREHRKGDGRKGGYQSLARLLEEAGLVRAVEVTCSCGETTVIELEYDPDPDPES